MALVSVPASDLFRDYVTDGVPGSGNHAPVKSQLRTWGTEIEIGLASAAGGFIVYDTRANLYADLDWPAATGAHVVADSTTAYNGIYAKSGASGAGAWTRVADLPTGAPGAAGPAGISWEGDWVTATAYAIADAVSVDGVAYICTSAHTSGASTQPGSGASWTTVWDVLATAGDLHLGGRIRPTRDTAVGYSSHKNNQTFGTGTIGTVATFVPIIITKSGSFSSLSAYCNTGESAKSMRMALYAASAADFFPGVLAKDFGTADLTSAGWKTQSVTPFSLAAGLYYILWQCNSSSVVFRGSAETVDLGAGFLGTDRPYGITTLRAAALSFGSPPADVTAWTIGSSTDQLAYTNNLFSPAFILN